MAAAARPNRENEVMLISLLLLTRMNSDPLLPEAELGEFTGIWPDKQTAVRMPWSGLRAFASRHAEQMPEVADRDGGLDRL